MAGVFVRASLTAEITLGNSGGWKTLLLFQEAANSRSKAVTWGVYPMGTVNTDQHIRTRIIKASDVGTGGTAAAKKTLNAIAETPRGTFTQGTFGTEPNVAGAVALNDKSAHPQGGGIEWPSTEQYECQIGSSEILCVQYWNDGGAANIKAKADLLLEQ
jgi:hypothetical protein